LIADGLSETTDCKDGLTRATAKGPDAQFDLTAESPRLSWPPMTDGNGRLARALVHGTLAQGGLVRAPVLPLAPAFYASADVVRTALKELSRTGDWFTAIESLSEILSLACVLAEMTEKLVSSVQAHSARNEHAAAETR
jgi:Fic family protein